MAGHCAAGGGAARERCYLGVFTRRSRDGVRSDQGRGDPGAFRLRRGDRATPARSGADRDPGTDDRVTRGCLGGVDAQHGAGRLRLAQRFPAVPGSDRDTRCARPAARDDRRDHLRRRLATRLDHHDRHLEPGLGLAFHTRSVPSRPQRAFPLLALRRRQHCAPRIQPLQCPERECGGRDHCARSALDAPLLADLAEGHPEPAAPGRDRPHAVAQWLHRTRDARGHAHRLGAVSRPPDARLGDVHGRDRGCGGRADALPLRRQGDLARR